MVKVSWGLVCKVTDRLAALTVAFSCPKEGTPELTHLVP